MLQYLKSQYKPGQRIAIFTLTDRLSLLQDFTGDPEVLIASLERFAATDPAASRASSGAGPSLNSLRVNPQQYLAMTAAFERFQKSETQNVADRRAELTLEALRRLTRMLGGLPGRKNVIWLTGGFPFTLNPDVGYATGAELSEMFRRPASIRSSSASAESLTASQKSPYVSRIREIAAQMASSQVAIYPVDVQGLLAFVDSNTSDRLETMREIARETGGRAFINRNDIDNGVAMAQRDRVCTYTVGYYPANKKWDHKYRAIDLKVNRPDLETTYRRGYFAVEGVSTGQEKLDQALSDAWQDGAPDTLVSFEAKMTAAENGKARVDFLVNANSVSVGEEANGKKVDVGFYVAPIAPDGKVLRIQGVKLDRVFSEDVYRRILQEGMRLHIDAEVPSDCKELYLAVRDNRTGYVGTLRGQIPDKQ